MGADGPAVGVGGHHRPPGQTHHVPEARIRQMGHVYVDGQLLHPLKEVPAISGQSPSWACWALEPRDICSSTPGSAAARPSHRQCPAAGCRSPAARRPRCSAAPPPCPAPRPRPHPPRCGRGGCVPGSPPSPAGTADGAGYPAGMELPSGTSWGSEHRGKRIAGRSGSFPRPALCIDVSAAAAQIARNVVEGPQLRVPEERPRRVAAVDGVAVCVKIGNRMYHLKMRFRCILCGWRRGSAPRRYRPLPRRSGRKVVSPLSIR